jgi:hypothetical protein
MAEQLVGYAKRDLIVPQQPFDDHRTANDAAAMWCAEVNAATHAEICAVPDGSWLWSSRCSVCCRRCGWNGPLGRSAGRSTGCRTSVSARPATRCRAD